MMPSRTCGVVGVFVIACAATAQDTPPAPPAPPASQRPTYKLLRQDEDWSFLRDADPDVPGDFFDPIKFIPLNEDGSIWASFGGHTRFRLEAWSGFNFDSSQDDTFLLWRAFFHGDLHFGENVRVFAEGKSALSTDRDLPGGTRTVDVDTIDLEQAFVDVKVPIGADGELTFRPGRQAFAFGKQRLVSPLAWANTQRRWDGISGIYKTGDWTVTGFWSQFVPVDKYELNQADSQTQLYGVYASGIHPSGIGVDAYFLGLYKGDDITFNGTTGPEDRFTLGGRLFGDVENTDLDYELEGAYQFGEVGSGDVDAFMIATQVGWSLSDVFASPRLFLGFDYATGDRVAGGDVETFNQLFPLGHAYLGYMDFVARQNIIDFNMGATAKPRSDLTLRLAGHLFWRAETDDALYDVGGAVLRAGGLGGSSEIGQEINFTAIYQFDRHLALEFGYGHFFAGDFLDESGTGDDADFLYVQAQYTF